jgi:hypothetical protein
LWPRAADPRGPAPAASLGLKVSPAFPSPLKGPKGNQEYFLYLILPDGPPEHIDKLVD